MGSQEFSKKGEVKPLFELGERVGYMFTAEDKETAEAAIRTKSGADLTELAIARRLVILGTRNMKPSYQATYYLAQLGGIGENPGQTHPAYFLHYPSVAEHIARVNRNGAETPPKNVELSEVDKAVGWEDAYNGPKHIVDPIPETI